MLSWHYNFVSLKFEKHVYIVTVLKLLYVVCQILFSLSLNSKKKSWETGKQIFFGWHNFTLSRQSICQKDICCREIPGFTERHTPLSLTLPLLVNTICQLFILLQYRIMKLTFMHYEWLIYGWR